MAEIKKYVDLVGLGVFKTENDKVTDTKIKELADGAVKTNTVAITTLNGEGEGSVNKKITDAFNEFATKVTDDAVVNSYKELIDWAAEHGSDATEMAAAIQALEAIVDGIGGEGESATVVSYVTSAIEALKIGDYAKASELGDAVDRIAALEEAVGEGGSIDSQIDTKIAELDADVTSAVVEEGKGLQVKVVEADGKITSVAVTGNFDNSYDAVGSAAQVKTDVIGTTEDTASDDTINGAKAATKAVSDRVDSLEAITVEAIPSSEIEALFATT